jgi:hypothetical protein
MRREQNRKSDSTRRKTTEKFETLIKRKQNAYNDKQSPSPLLVHAQHVTKEGENGWPWRKGGDGGN